MKYILTVLATAHDCNLENSLCHTFELLVLCLLSQQEFACMKCSCEVMNLHSHKQTVPAVIASLRTCAVLMFRSVPCASESL